VRGLPAPKPGLTMWRIEQLLPLKFINLLKFEAPLNIIKKNMVPTSQEILFELQICIWFEPKT
jgi:hypothetical protein